MKMFIITTALMFSGAAHAGDSVCKQQAIDAVVGMVKGLGQDVVYDDFAFIESTSDGAAAYEVLEVKVKGNGFSSAETNGTWEIQLYDLGSGCAFKSLTLKN